MARKLFNFHVNEDLDAFEIDFLLYGLWDINSNAAGTITSYSAFFPGITTFALNVLSDPQIKENMALFDCNVEKIFDAVKIYSYVLKGKDLKKKYGAHPRYVLMQQKSSKLVYFVPNGPIKIRILC